MKEKLIDYFNLLLQNRREEDPYYQLLGDSLSIYETIWNTEMFIGKLLGIPEEWIETVMEYSYSGSVCINGEIITDVEEFTNIILEVMEEKL